MTYIAVSIQGRAVPEYMARLESVSLSGADIAELRCDYLTDLSPQHVVQLIRAAKKTPFKTLVTCRDKNQGGQGDWDSQRRTAVLVSAVEAGADFIDCEYDNFVVPQIRGAIEKALQSRPRCRLILSAHNFQGPFEDINILYESILSVCPAAIPKIVFTANHIIDCFGAFDLLHDKEEDAIIFCMGPAGMISRVLARKFNSFLTFVSLEDQQATAPGQITIRQMKEVYRWDKINEQTEVFGVIGDPVYHSLGPSLFNACFEHDGINAVHLPFHVQQEKTGFDLFMQGVVSRPWMHVGGFSVTIPHKTNALDFAGHQGGFVEVLATTIGAVNTLKLGFNNIVSAYNTDYAGAMEALTLTLGIDKHQLHSVKVAVIGSGGAARAVVAGLANVGADITIYNRTVNKAMLLAQEFRCKACGLEELANLDAAVVINCTSIGMSPNVDASPVPAGIVKEGMTAFDTVYTPLHTRFLKESQAAGAKIVDGAEMFIRQAMLQYRIFFGKEPDEAVMRKVVFDKLGKAK